MNKMFSLIKSQIQKSEKPKKIDWVLVTVIIIMSFLFFSQNSDMTITARQSLDLIDATLKGQFFHFYSYTYNLALSGAYGPKTVISAAYYSIFMYCTFAVWNIPFWILSSVLHVKISFFALMMWDKVLILIFVLLCTYVLYKIALLLKMDKNKSKWLAFVYLSSPILLFGSILFTQYDIFCVFFILISMYYFFKKDLLRFSIFMALAICYKDFAILIFIPLILLTEKRMFHIIKYYIIGLSLFVIHSFVFSKDPGYKITQKAMNTYYGFFRNFVSIGLSTGNGIVFFVGLALIFACIFSYRRTVKNDYDLVKCATYIPLFMFGIFFSFISFHPQWVIILVPFIVLCSFVNKDFKLSMFIDIVISIGYLCFSFTTFLDNVDQNMVNNGILPHIFHFVYNNSVKLVDLVNRYGIPENLFVTMFVSGIFALLILFYPKSKNQELESHENESAFLPERSVLWVRALSIFVFIAPTLALYFYQMIKLR